GGVTIQMFAADPRTANIPIVVSAPTDAIAFDTARDGADEPAAADRLLREIERVLARAPHGKILLTEDDDDLRSVLSSALTRKGFQVLAAPDGELARRIFDGSPCDVALLDLQMPELDGFGLIEYIRSTS